MGDDFMGNNNKINPIKQNLRMKQFIGWFIAIISPFAAKGLMEASKVPLLTALVFWLVCGVILRFILEKQLPYFEPQVDKVKKETIALALVTIIFIVIYLSNIVFVAIPLRELLLNVIFFAFLNGVLEQLIMINIYDMAGCRVRLSGLIAAFLYALLIYTIFWGSFMPNPVFNTFVFVIIEAITFTLPLAIYEKTHDLTIWSIQRLICNVIIVYFGGFSINMFITL
jgi:hypothetical protein